MEIQKTPSITGIYIVRIFKITVLPGDFYLGGTPSFVFPVPTKGTPVILIHATFSLYDSSVPLKLAPLALRLRQTESPFLPFMYRSGGAPTSEQVFIESPSEATLSLPVVKRVRRRRRRRRGRRRRPRGESQQRGSDKRRSARRRTVRQR